MQDHLKIAIIQSDLVWENPEANCQHFKEKIEALTPPIDLVILPEMFTTGFTMHASKVAETMEGESVQWMLNLAASKDCALMGSLIIEEHNKFYNRLFFVHPDGTIQTYDKHHTFSLVGEDKVYTAGTDKLIVEYKGWKLCPMVCYDLRFPVWARNVEDYDALFFVANWPKPRIFAWDTLLKARAIENMSYCIGVNRVGLDDKGNEYCGHSAVYDTLGNNITPIRPNKEHIEVVTLERNHINFYRNKLKFLNDKDDFTLK